MKFLPPLFICLLFVLFTQRIIAQDCKCTEAIPLKSKFIDYMEQSKIDSAKLILAKFEKMKSPDCESYFYSYSAFLAIRARD